MKYFIFSMILWVMSVSADNMPSQVNNNGDGSSALMVIVTQLINEQNVKTKNTNELVAALNHTYYKAFSGNDNNQNRISIGQH